MSYTTRFRTTRLAGGAVTVECGPTVEGAGSLTARAAHERLLDRVKRLVEEFYASSEGPDRSRVAPARSSGAPLVD